jgi:adenylate kinase
MRLTLLGPPGSGKGTQAATLAKSLGVAHIATGDLLRAAIASNSQLGKLAQEYITHGNLVPDEVVNNMVRQRLGRSDSQGFVLDGYPRTVEQARTLEQILEELEIPLSTAILLDVPDEAIVERAVGRVVCSQCDAIYHLTSKPPRLMGVCDICRGVLQARKDDHPSTVRHRLRVYHRLTEPVLQFYRERSLLRSISGIGEPAEVRDRLYAQLQVC